jgi:hypothetical protein
MKVRVVNIAGAALDLAGFVCLAHFAGWAVAVGVFAMICGNNLERLP